MEDIEKALKGTFIGAANQLTQLYVQGLQQQKNSFAIGYNSALENVIQFVINSSNGSSPNINMDLLLEFLKKERSKYPQPSSPSSPDLKNDVNDIRPSTPTPTSTPAPASSITSLPSQSNSNDGFHFQTPIDKSPTPSTTGSDEVFTFSAPQSPNAPQLNSPFLWNTNPTAPQPTSPIMSTHFRQHRPHNSTHARLLQQSQIESASRKRQIDLIFNPSIVDILKPMDKLLKKIKIDQ